MQTRTVELSDTTTITPAAGGRFIIRTRDSVEMIRPPTGRVQLVTSKRSTLSFGSPTRASLVVVGAKDALTPVFAAITGVTP